MSATQTVTAWPGVAALRGLFAEQASRTAQKRQDDTGWTVEETRRQVRAAAVDAAECIAMALVDAAEMGLDVWEATR
jgi:hypothetical protein